MFWAWVAPYPEAWNVTVHSNCMHSEWAALVERHLLPVDVPCDADLQPMERERDILVGRLKAMSLGPLVPWKHQRVVDCYEGPKRRKYQEALESLLKDGPVERRDAAITAFVKAEKRLLRKPKQPRCIQFRTARYTLALMAYLRPVIKLVSRIHTTTYPGQPRTKASPAGLNAHERAALIIKKFESVPDCVALSMDVSGFDYRVSAELLRFEHSVYKRLYPNDPVLERYLSYQYLNRGRTGKGIKYWCYGRRMSGDANTSVGNWLLMYMMLMTAHTEARVPWEMIIDGDDVIVFVQRKHAKRAERVLVDTFARSGHRLVVEGIFTRWSEIVYSQAKIVWGHGGWRLSRNPWKVIGTAFAGHKHFHEKKGGQRALRTLAQGLLASNLGVPIIQSLAVGVLSSLRAVEWMDAVIDSEQLRQLRRIKDDWHTVQAIPVTQKAREATEEAWDIDCDAQRRIEEYLERDRSDMFAALDFKWSPEQWLRSTIGPLMVGDRWDEE